MPVFDTGASATENSLITHGRSLFVENNYGYQDPFGPNSGALTEPGFARVDVNRNGTGCRMVWTNTTERAPTVVPKLSTRTGLIYTYTRDPAPAAASPTSGRRSAPAPGKTAFKVYAGNGLGFNNNYAGLALGPTARLPRRDQRPGRVAGRLRPARRPECPGLAIIDAPLDCSAGRGECSRPPHSAQPD